VISTWRGANIRGLTSLETLSQTSVRPVGVFKFQTTYNSPGGANPATRSAWTCVQLAIAKSPTCGKDVNIGAGLLIGYNFGPVELKFIYANAFYARDTVGSNTWFRVRSENLVQAVVSRRSSQEDLDHQVTGRRDRATVAWLRFLKGPQLLRTHNRRGAGQRFV
jgi:hypothetical protein